MSDTYYPPPGFYFRVTVLGAGALVAEATGMDASFQEVSGIEARFDTEDVVEGGENRYVHRLPRPARYADLVLKRGVVTRDSFFAEWVGLTVGSGLSLPIVTQTLLVTLLDPGGFPVVAWAFVDAWPLKWVTAPLDSQANQVLTETMEFAYSYFERITLGGGLSAAVKLARVAAAFA